MNIKIANLLSLLCERSIVETPHKSFVPCLVNQKMLDKLLLIEMKLQDGGLI
jgi:hypothetical protein